MNILIYFLLTLLVIVSVLMVLIVLMQRPKNEGLGASFGGGMTQDLFGAQTTNVLQKFTVYLGGVFFVLTLTLTVLYSKTSTSKPLVPLAPKGIPATQAAPIVAETPAPTPVAATVPPTATPAPLPANSAPQVEQTTPPPPVESSPAPTATP